MPMDPSKMAAFAGGPVPDADDATEGGEDDAVVEHDGTDLGELIPLLEEHAAEIEDQAAQMGADPASILNGDPPDQSVVENVNMGIGELEDDLKEGLMALVGVEPDQCAEVAAHLADEGMIEDPDTVAAWLYVVSLLVAAAGSDEGGDDEEAPPDDAGAVEGGEPA